MSSRCEGFYWSELRGLTGYIGDCSLRSAENGRLCFLLKTRSGAYAPGVIFISKTEVLYMIPQTLERKIHAKDRYVKISDIYFDIGNCTAVANIICSIDYLVKIMPASIHTGTRPLLNANGCRMLLQLFPVLIYKEEDKFICFGGLRTFLLAQMIFPSHEKIPVRLFDEKVSAPEEYAFAGLFLGEIFLLLKSTSELGRIVNAMPAELLSKWLEGVTNKSQLAKALGIRKHHFHKPRKVEVEK